ncbi:hypothetical protein OIU91_37615 [Streptomyces sp. NBC_01456]|uniref:hypothetical protein n=1 Tax=unclassified Streptomyces TaxID=2593676 RepID=UPI002E358391|nr:MULTISPECIES: hypothetical protein [unclassified Streptomyces]
MRDSVSTGRPAARDGRRMLLLLALLALLFAALTPCCVHGPALDPTGCPLRAGSPAASTPAEGPCLPAGPVLASNEGGGKHPGSGVRRLCDATVCHLRPHLPTGAGGKTLGGSPVTAISPAPGGGSSAAVMTAAAPAAPKRAAVLRC